MTRKFRPQPYEKPKPRPKTVHVICAACTEHYYLTITALPNEYAEALKKHRCTHCRVVGKLATSDIVKARPRCRGQHQLSLDFFKKP